MTLVRCYSRQHQGENPLPATNFTPDSRRPRGFRAICTWCERRERRDRRQRGRPRRPAPPPTPITRIEEVLVRDEAGRLVRPSELAARYRTENQIFAPNEPHDWWEQGENA